MWFKGNKTEVKDLFMQNKIISQEKNKDIEQCICASTGGISKRLKGDEFSEGWIKKIYYRNDLLFWHNSSDSGREVNINDQKVYTTNTTFASNLTNNGACTRHQTGHSDSFSPKIQLPD
jgi:hypothetical protein